MLRRMGLWDEVGYGMEVGVKVFVGMILTKIKKIVHWENTSTNQGLG